MEFMAQKSSLRFFVGLKVFGHFLFSFSKVHQISYFKKERFGNKKI
jgi:hypothetical protein